MANGTWTETPVKPFTLIDAHAVLFARVNGHWRGAVQVSEKMEFIDVLYVRVDGWTFPWNAAAAALCKNPPKSCAAPTFNLDTPNGPEPSPLRALGASIAASPNSSTFRPT